MSKTFEKIGKGTSAVVLLGIAGGGLYLLMKNKTASTKPEIPDEKSTYTPPPLDISKQPIIKTAPLNVSLVSLSQFMQYSAAEVNNYLSQLEAQLGSKLIVDASKLPELGVYEGYINSQKLTVENLSAQKTRMESNVSTLESEKQAAYQALTPLKQSYSQLEQLIDLYGVALVNSQDWRVRTFSNSWLTVDGYKELVNEPQITPLEALIPADNTRGNLAKYIDFYWFGDISGLEAMLIEGNIQQLQDNAGAYKYTFYATYIAEKEALYNTKANDFQKASDDLTSFLRDQYTPAITQLTAYQNQYNSLKNALYVSIKVMNA